jgi:hypothetical protein
MVKLKETDAKAEKEVPVYVGGVPQAGARGTTIEDVTNARQMFTFLFKLRRPSSVDCLGGNGNYAVVRYCRHTHLKGEHYYPYRHIVFQQFLTLEQAREDVMKPCQKLPDRITDLGASCGVDEHSILLAICHKGKWRCRRLPSEA